MKFEIIKHYLTENDCYKSGQKRTKTSGVLRHSTGCNNPNLCRYIDDPENLGENKYNNHWNQHQEGTAKKCVHFMIGLDKNGKIAIYQTLPLDYRCYGCGSGKNGSYNNTHIQYEILEDGLEDEKYYYAAMDAAEWLDAYLLKLYNLSPEKLISHKEAAAAGYASNHADPEHWMQRFEEDMDVARAHVKKKMVVEATPAVKEEAKQEKEPYEIGKVYTLQTELKVRKGAGTNYVALKHSQLTAGGKKADKDKDGCLDKGTRVTCKAVKKVGKDIWIKCPSGWLAAIYKEKVYIK